jgi:hypothetical protein
VRDTWQVGPTTRLVFSDRLNVRAESDLSFPDRESIANDFRETYLEWRLADQTYLAFGRINLKSGIAIGYNPTDYFRTRTVTEPLTADPTVLREDRLGTVMARLQRIWRGGSITVAFAPRLRRQSPIYSNTELPNVDPLLGQTNSDDRFLVKGSADVAPDFSPEVLLYHDSHYTQAGLNLSMTLGQSVVAYLDESAAKRRDLVAEAFGFGRATGPLPLALDQQEQSTEQAAFVRADWTDAFGLNLELSGFADVDLRDGSGQAQAEADYYLSNAWTVGVLAAGDFGAARSDFGSLPTAYNVLLYARRYF